MIEKFVGLSLLTGIAYLSYEAAAVGFVVGTGAHILATCAVAVVFALALKRVVA